MTVPPDPFDGRGSGSDPGAEPAEPRAGTRADPAVERVRAELAALPAVPMPPDVAARIELALVDAARDDPNRDAPVRAGVPETDVLRTGSARLGSVRLGSVQGGSVQGGSVRGGSRPAASAPGGSVRARGRPSRSTRSGRRRPLVTAAVLTCAAAVGIVLVGTPRGDDGPHPAGVQDDLRTAGSAALGRDGAGQLADPARRRACLAAAGVADPDAPLLGGAPRTVDGTPGTLLVLGSDVVGRYRLVVVDTACRRSVAETTVGR